jgi:hypothetical protein
MGVKLFKIFFEFFRSGSPAKTCASTKGSDSIPSPHAIPIMTSLHIGVAQIHSGGVLAENFKRLERQVRAAAVLGVEVLLFAECALHGYDGQMNPESVRAVAETIDGPNCMAVRRLAREQGVHILVGFFEKDGDRFHNSQLVAYADGRVGIQRKYNLTPAEKSAGLTPGALQREIFTFKGIRTIINICADKDIVELPAGVKQEDIRLAFAPCGGGGDIGEMLAARTLRTEEGRGQYSKNRPRVFLDKPFHEPSSLPHAGLAAVNALGPVGQATCHQGHCLIIDPDQVIRVQVPGTIVLEHQQDQMAHCVIDFD